VRLPGRVVSAGTCVLALAVAPLACGRGGDDEPVSLSPTARYTILQLSAGESDAEVRTEGLGDFSRGELSDTQYLADKPFAERLTIGNVIYRRLFGEDTWNKDVAAPTPQSKALVAVRNALFDPSRALGYLRSVSDDVRSEGSDHVRGDKATHYRATVDLGRAGGPEGYLLHLEVWVDESGRVRRLRYPLLGEPETTIVWELYDFGVAVNLTAPPPDKVR
jgi:hypothetical protein